MYPNFWGTLEIYCVSAAHDYEKGYLYFHQKEGYSYAPLCREAYETLSKLLDQQMRHDFGLEENDTTE